MVDRLLYDLETPTKELFHFSEISTLEVTSLLHDSTRIIAAQIVAYNQSEYLDKEIYENLKTVAEFNRFFINNRRFYIHDLELLLEGELELHTHDDGEATIYQRVGYQDRALIKSLFHMKGLPQSLIEEIMKMPGHYFSIDAFGKILSVHKTFDDYLNRNR